MCDAGYEGEVCDKVICQPKDCNNHGRCIERNCHCFNGYWGPDCNTKKCLNGCDHGKCNNGNCICDEVTYLLVEIKIEEVFYFTDVSYILIY